MTTRKNDHNKSKGTMAIEQHIAELLSTYRAKRRELGVALADKELMKDPVTLWCHNLLASEKDYQELDELTRLTIAIGMTETLAIRDALIVSFLCDREQLKPDTVLQLTCKPHEQSSVRLLCQAVDGAFTDSRIRPDHTRCSAGLKMLEEIVSLVPESFQEQPLAVLAYLHWWLGADEGAALARRALEINERCTLASIIEAAFRHYVRPAWVTQPTSSC
ncbi:hypothetical protein [Bombiscardovia coagulans]|uniref:Uncharacterized protein n=1 Tax=Bombiscardovia coagulans TaxID=686666 RepID=A0A261EVT2_9BIFI|nr:hypothetical protein [Bombiscardovia coagulans]OZG50990.1 hypothetical protein BOCO_0176 [Bombiscardovia coagulans]